MRKTHALFIPLLCLLFLFSWRASASESHPASQLPLSQSQQTWLKAHPIIRVGIDPDYPPYEYLNNQQHHSGLSRDYLKILSKMLGVRFKVAPHLSWQQVLGAAHQKKIDLISTITATPERKKFLKFTDVYIKYQVAIVSQQGQAFKSLQTLTGHKVALIKNYASTELILAKKTHIQPVYVDSVIEGLKRVLDGSADAMISDVGSMSYKIREFGFSSLKLTGFLNLQTKGLAMGVRDDWSELVEILNIALGHIPEAQKYALNKRWLNPDVSPPKAKKSIKLSLQEKAFIQKHSNIRLGIDPEFIPFEFMDKHAVYSGMVSDYIKLLNQRLGINMQVIEHTSWKKAVEKAKKRQLDVLPSVGITEERKAYFLFSKAYIHFNRVVITRTDSQFIAGLDDIEAMRVAVQKNSSHEGYLKEHSHISPLRYPSLKASLTAVSTGKADAFVGNLASTMYWIRELNLTNLKIAASLSGAKQGEGLHFAIRNDWPELVSIINKGLASISYIERQQISKKWVHVQFDPKVDYTMLWKTVIILSSILILALLWNMKIRKERLRAQIAKEEAETAKAALEESNLKLNAIFDSAGAGIVLLKGRIITNCNHCMDEMYGCEEGEQIGKSTRMWYADDAVYEQIGQQTYAHISRGEPYIGEVEAMRKDGSCFWARASVRAIDSKNLEKGLVAVIEDITEERRIIENMATTQASLQKANQKLKELDQLKSMFIASMSHELRTPLNSIIGFSGLLLQGVSGDISQEQRDDIQRIYYSGKHLLDLITDVIDISKIEAGRVEIYASDFQLSDVIMEAVQLVEVQRKEKDLQLNLELENDIQMHADRKRLLQCLLNLLSNAVKYSECGSITVTACHKHGEVIISVADTGIGIPDDALPKLFEAFERLESHLRVKAGGTGLGLYLTKKIVHDILAGSIDVNSQVGKGSQFTITLAQNIKEMEA